MTIRIHTIGDFKQQGYRITAYCLHQYGGIPCNHSAEVDLDVLEKRFGADWSLYGENRLTLMALLRCKSCGGRDIQLQVSPGNTGLAAPVGLQTGGEIPGS
jgi:hypothetical protein